MCIVVYNLYLLNIFIEKEVDLGLDLVILWFDCSLWSFFRVWI